jgi:glutamate mutase epsilon subunit
MTRGRLTCQEVVERATDYFDASLPTAESERFAAHVAGCRGCQTYLRQLRITVDVVHTAGDAEAVVPSSLLSAFRDWRGAGEADVDSA